MAKNAFGASPAVILTMEDESCLPIYIGLWEAMSIHAALQNEIPPRPLTHDLFVESFQRLGITLKSLVIDSLNEGVYYATMVLVQDHHEVTLDCRPSDGIAIGIRCNARILIDEDVVRQSAIPAGELPELLDIRSYLAG
jgi:hypothetical protein